MRKAYTGTAPLCGRRAEGSPSRVLAAGRWHSLCLVLAALAIPPWAPGQAKTGTTIGQFLLIEPSAQLAAMGNAGTAIAGQVVAGYFNPGAWGHLEQSQAQFTQGVWLAGISYNYAAVGIKTGANGLMAITVTSLNSGEIDVRTPQQPLGTGEKYSVSNMAIGLGYGLRLTDRFSAGIQAKYIQESIWHSSLTAFAIDIGTLYQLSSDGLLIGACISNFGTRARYQGSDLRIRYDNDPSIYGDNSNLPSEIFTEEFPLPILFRVGLAYPVQVATNHRVLVVADASHPSDNTESVNVGAEWRFLDMVSVRAGYQQLFKQYSEVGLTFGGGLQYELLGYPLSLDYAWADHGRLDDTQRITFGIRF